MKPKQNLLSFYKEHGISPVRQDVADLARHFERRNALFSHLGIPTRLLSGRRILEVGPGSGYNSLHLAVLNPLTLDLVEANPKGFEHIQKLFQGYPDLASKLTVYNQEVESFKTENPYDLVVCEAMLPSVSNPKATASLLGTFVAPGGILSVTCTDEVQAFGEAIRRLLVPFFVSKEMTIEQQVEILTPIFSPHLSTLKGMSRRHDDWVVDNLINPYYVTDFFSFEDAILALGDSFDVYGASPNIFTDWRWFKAVPLDSSSINDLALQQFNENHHSFLDYRSVFPARNVDDNKNLVSALKRFHKATEEFWKSKNNNSLHEASQALKAITANLRAVSMELADSIEKIAHQISQSHVDADFIAKEPQFAGLFGRGQFFVSMVKRI